MPTMTPVDIDPFAASAGPTMPTLTPVDHDPFAPQWQADGAPAGLANVATPASDPIYHGAVPVAAAPDQGGGLAFASGVGGVPVIGPAIEGGLQRLAAGARSLMGGGSYGDELQHVQDMTDIARQQHPAAAFTGDLTGAALALGPATEVAPAAFGLGGPVTAGRLGVGALSGASLGASDAAVRGGSPSAITEGLVGGALGGAAAPVIGAAASRLTGAAADLASRTLSPTPGMTRPVADVLSRALVNDGTMAGQGAANLAASGSRAMLADASPSFAGVLDTALQHGGPGAAVARSAIEARAAGANADLTGALDQTLGAPQGVASASADIRDSTAAARQRAYDTAYAQPIDYSSDHGRALEDMITNRVPPGIMARAAQQMRVDGQIPTQQMMASVAPDGAVSYRQMPDVRMVDYITRSLNDVAKAGDGQGLLGGNTAEGRSYGALARDLRDTLRNAVPEYGTALDTAAQPIQARNALDFGAQLLHPSTPADVAASTIGDMTGPEMDHVRQGVRAHISDTMANVGRTITDPNVDARQAMASVKMLSSDAAQQKLGMLLDPSAQTGLQNALGGATRALELRGAVTRNSATYGRGVAGQVVNQAAQPGMVTRMATAGGPMKATRPLFETILGSRPEDIAARETAMHGELARLLTSPQGPAAGGVLSDLARSYAARDAASSIAGAIPYGQLSHAGIFAPLLALQQSGAQ